MANNSGASRRAALRQQQELEARQSRNRKIMAMVLGAITLVVVGVLGFVVWQTVSKKTETVGPQQTPPNATAEGGIRWTRDGEAPTDVPHLVIYQDYQCPACASFEQTYGPAVNQLFDEGKITVETVTATFIEVNVRNDSSTRAAMAAAAADAVGKYHPYLSTVFKNQPQEGLGFTEQQLRVDFPAQAGIEGDDLKKFQELYDGKVYADFVKKSHDAFMKSGFKATPTYAVKGKKLEFVDDKNQIQIQPTPEDMLRAITEANA